MDSTTYKICFEVAQSLLDQLPEIRVQPRLDADSLNGVSALDMVLVMRNILGIQPFTKAYQVIGADVTGEAIVSAFDIVKSQQVILGQIIAFDVPE